MSISGAGGGVEKGGRPYPIDYKGHTSHHIGTPRGTPILMITLDLGSLEGARLCSKGG